QGGPCDSGGGYARGSTCGSTGCRRWIRLIHRRSGDYDGTMSETRPVDDTPNSPLVGVIMGSDSDFSVMADAVQALRDFGIAHEVEVVSAHRTPDKMVSYAREAAGRGLKVIIAGAGGAA